MSQRRAHEKTSASATSADADEKAFSPVSPQITEKEVEDVEERSARARRSSMKSCDALAMKRWHGR